MMTIIERQFTLKEGNVLLTTILQNSAGINVRIIINSGLSIMENYARIQVLEKGSYKGVSYLYSALMHTPIKLYAKCSPNNNSQEIDNAVGVMFQEDIMCLLNEAGTILKTTWK